MPSSSQQAPAHVPIRSAASVILYRDGSEALEVFVQHRALSMDFAAGMLVFPGGRVDSADAPEATQLVHCSSAHARAWQQTSLGNNAVGAATLVATAVRELKEETGVGIGPERLVPWANWITPADQAKRFDTYFYACELPLSPAEPQPQHRTTEATSSVWLGVPAILAAAASGTLLLMRPTRYLLEELRDLGSAGAIGSVRRDTIKPVRGAVTPTQNTDTDAERRIRSEMNDQ